MVNAYSICNPTTIKNIYDAFKRAKIQGYASYVYNSKGYAIMRIGFDDETGEVRFFVGNRDIGSIVRKALLLFTKNTGRYHWNVA